MKQEQNFNYESPRVEIIEVQVEQGFATSGGTQGLGEGNGAW